MARTTMAIQTNYSQEQVSRVLKEYFEKRGYSEKNYKGEIVIEKSLAAGLVAPHYLKFQLQPNLVILEGWVNAFGKEREADGGLVGAGPKRDLKKTLDEIRALLESGSTQYSETVYPQQPHIQTHATAYSQPQSQYSGTTYPQQQNTGGPYPQQQFQQHPGGIYPQPQHPSGEYPQQQNTSGPYPQQPPAQNHGSTYAAVPVDSVNDTSSLKISSDQKKYSYLSVIVPVSFFLITIPFPVNYFWNVFVYGVGITFAKTGKKSSKKNFATAGMIINIILLSLVTISFIINLVAAFN